MKELHQYRLLEEKLRLLRKHNQGQESPEEDAILDLMDQSWRRLSMIDQDLVRSEGSMCW